MNQNKLSKMQMGSTNRIYQIDLFRFIAALSVMLFHYLFRGHAADNMTTLNFSEISSFFKYGYLGVDLFFIISGFVIALSIKDNSLLKFVTSRVVRLYPAYWFCVTVTFVTIVFFGAPSYKASLNQYLVNLTMLQGFLKTEHIDGVYWTLVIEMKFYLLVGFFLFINKYKKIHLNYFIYVWLCITFLYVFNNQSNYFALASKIFMPEWSSYFIAGVIFYQIFKDGLNIKNIIALLACLIISLYFALHDLENHVRHYKTTFSPYVVSTTILMFYLLMLLASTNNLKFLNTPKLLKLGILTYPLYLLHENVGFIIFNNFDGIINKYLIFASTSLLMILLSYLISNKIEKPLAIFMKRKIDMVTAKISKRPVSHKFS